MKVYKRLSIYYILFVTIYYCQYCNAVTYGYNPPTVIWPLYSLPFAPYGNPPIPPNGGPPMPPDGLSPVERHPLPRMNLPIILKYGVFNKLADYIKIRIYEVPKEAKRVRIMNMGYNSVDIQSQEYDVKTDKMAVLNFHSGENKLFVSLLTVNYKECGKKLVIEEDEHGSDISEWDDCISKKECLIDINWERTCDRLKDSNGTSSKGNTGNNKINEHADRNGDNKLIPTTKAPFHDNRGTPSTIQLVDDMTTVSPFSVKDNKPSPGTTEATFSKDDSNVYYYIGAAIAGIILILAILLIYLKRTKKKSAILPMLDDQRTEVNDSRSDKLRFNQPLYADLDLLSRSDKKPVIEETPYAQIQNPDTVMYAHLDLPRSTKIPRVEETPYAQIIQLGPKT